ncbi:rod shape-determining protein MreD [Bacillus sp. OK048]|uniref:rod shape-determining protein MreD n=1 Tax=Bacillus sp. OK048 TaxID=1882761 RepID=UPI00088F8197|nr:rod shape-determining protein MreD [Bacillus sp. OK048]SDM23218.1 rod shape-determining protein MreD [Bacillus sp. OK048]
MKKLLLPLLFLFLFLLESMFVQYAPPKVFGHDYILVPHFLFAGILFLTIYAGRKYGIIYGAIFGLLFDIVWIEIIGIYFFLFPFVAYLISKIMHVLQTNIIVAFLISLVGIALLELGVYEMDFLIHITTLEFMSFLKMRLYPSLLLNAVFLVIVSYPFKRQFEKFAESIRDE